MIVDETDHLSVDDLDRVYLVRRPDRPLEAPAAAWLRIARWVRGFFAPDDPGAAVAGDEDPYCLGFVDRDPAWPTLLFGPEPRWYPTELADLLDSWQAWCEESRNYREHVQRSYLDGLGDPRRW